MSFRRKGPATKKQVARKRIRDAKSVTFMDYSEKNGLPMWRVETGEPHADLIVYEAGIPGADSR